MKMENVRNNNNFYLNIELVAPDDLQNLVLEIQKSLILPANIDYMPGKSWCPVHLTLYSTYSSMKAIKSMVDVSKKIVEAYKPILISINGIGCFDDGSIYLKCERTPDLAALHMEIVTNLSPLRDVKEPPPELLRELSKEQIARFRKVGDPFALENYIPHVTIVSLENYGEAIQLYKNIPKVEIKVTFSRIAARIWTSNSSKTAMLIWEQALK